MRKVHPAYALAALRSCQHSSLFMLSLSAPQETPVMSLESCQVLRVTLPCVLSAALLSAALQLPCNLAQGCLLHCILKGA